VRFIYLSAFGQYIGGLIEQKRADGYIYDSEEYLLKNFDDFCLSRFQETQTVTPEIVDAWSEIKPTEGKNTRKRRVVMLRQLCLYMLSLGIDTYVPRGNFSTEKPMLYIPTPSEITCFFQKLDSWRVYGSGSRPELDMRFLREYRIIFRLYYCCGLRLSEARLLRREHVDLTQGTITILQSKGAKDRLVYLPQDGVNMLAKYMRDIKREFPDSPWLFPGKAVGKPLAASSIHCKFATIWNLVPGSANAGKKPSPHCLRHAFVVERMNEWMRQGVNLQEMLPYLSKYLGHESPAETFYYYHLVDNAFAVVRQKDRISHRVIPEVIPFEED